MGRRAVRSVCIAVSSRTLSRYPINSIKVPVYFMWKSCLSASHWRRPKFQKSCCRKSSQFLKPVQSSFKENHFTAGPSKYVCGDDGQRHQVEYCPIDRAVSTPGLRLLYWAQGSYQNQDVNLAGVYEKSIHMVELDFLLKTRCPEYWKERKSAERIELMKQSREYWNMQTKYMIGYY